jgi:hypothetical protein
VYNETVLEVFAAMVVKIVIFWDIILCSKIKVNRRFGGTYSQAKNQHGLLFDHENGGDIFF